MTLTQKRKYESDEWEEEAEIGQHGAIRVIEFRGTARVQTENDKH